MSDRSCHALLERRDAALAATPGPWRTNDGKNSVVTEYAPGRERIRVKSWTDDNNFVCDINDGEYHEYLDENECRANAKHIAMSDPQTVVADIDEILDLRERVAQLEQLLEERNAFLGG